MQQHSKQEKWNWFLGLQVPSINGYKAKVKLVYLLNMKPTRISVSIHACVEERD